MRAKLFDENGNLLAEFGDGGYNSSRAGSPTRRNADDLRILNEDGTEKFFLKDTIITERMASAAKQRSEDEGDEAILRTRVRSAGKPKMISTTWEATVAKYLLFAAGIVIAVFVTLRVCEPKTTPPPAPAATVVTPATKPVATTPTPAAKATPNPKAQFGDCVQGKAAAIKSGSLTTQQVVSICSLAFGLPDPTPPTPTPAAPATH